LIERLRNLVRPLRVRWGRRVFYKIEELELASTIRERRLARDNHLTNDQLAPLSIIVKVKNEPEFLEAWLEYHGKLVGLDNILILDNESDSEKHLNLLKRYSDKAYVVRLPGFYDNFHYPHLYPQPYQWAASRSRYVTFLDIDEFLVARAGDCLSGKNLFSQLAHPETKAFAGIWLWNKEPLAAESLAVSDPVVFTAPDPGLLGYGTVAGKSIVRADALTEAKVVGHNLQNESMLPLFNDKSFGEIFVLHLSQLNPALMRKRSRQHLQAVGLLPAELDEESALKAISNALEAGEFTERSGPWRYATQFVTGRIIEPRREYFGEGPFATTAVNEFFTGFEVPELAEIVESFDFRQLLETEKNKFTQD